MLLLYQKIMLIEFSSDVSSYGSVSDDKDFWIIYVQIVGV